MRCIDLRGLNCIYPTTGNRGFDMEFSLSQEIDAPAAFVFQAVTEFERFEKAAVARGVTVQRRAASSDEGPGPVWDINFLFHARRLN